LRIKAERLVNSTESGMHVTNLHRTGSVFIFMGFAEESEEHENEN